MVVSTQFGYLSFITVSCCLALLLISALTYPPLNSCTNVPENGL